MRLDDDREVAEIGYWVARLELMTKTDSDL